MTANTATGYTPPAAARQYAPEIEAAAARANITPAILFELLNQESAYRPEIIDGRRKSPVGALGIAQFMPPTAREWGVDPLNPSSAIDGAARYLRWLLNAFNGNIAKALAAYNWGIGNVSRRGLAAAPTETRNYVTNIMARAGADPQVAIMRAAVESDINALG